MKVWFGFADGLVSLASLPWPAPPWASGAWLWSAGWGYLVDTFSLEDKPVPVQINVLDHVLLIGDKQSNYFYLKNNYFQNDLWDFDVFFFLIPAPSPSVNSWAAIQNVSLICPFLVISAVWGHCPLLPAPFPGPPVSPVSSPLQAGLPLPLHNK